MRTVGMMRPETIAGATLVLRTYFPDLNAELLLAALRQFDPVSQTFQFKQNPLDPLLTKKEVAEHLGVSMVTMERFIGERRFPFVKIGAQVRIKRSDLELFIDSDRYQPESNPTL